MCGIFAVVNNTSVTDSLLSGLSSLSYRGYDSSGIAIMKNGLLERRRAPGKLRHLTDLLSSDPLEGEVGIAHTRWATHGVADTRNAHPHMTAHVAVAHNGIVENYTSLRSDLEENGYLFESDTDSESIVQLITFYLDNELSPREALIMAMQKIKGNFGVVVIFKDEPNALYIAKNGSPMVIGYGDNSFLVSSDEMALHGKANTVIHLHDGDFAYITLNKFDIFNQYNIKQNRQKKTISPEHSNDNLGDFDYFMQKEIHEQPNVIQRTWATYYNVATQALDLPHLGIDIHLLTRLSVVACGTSYFAGMVCKYWLERLAHIPVDLEIASEYRYRQPPICANSAALFISQSGETADTLAALHYSKSIKQPCISLLNVLTSSMANESSAVLPTLAGKEIGVASTKAFIAQLSTLLILSLQIAKENGQLTPDKEQYIFSEFEKIPHQIHTFLRDTQHIDLIASQLTHARSILFLGRGTSYALAEEGALKLKEISYIHAEAYPAGELKHGPLALVDDNMPVVVIAPPDALFTKTLSNLREVATRGARVILISNKKGIEQARDFISCSIEMPDVDELLSPLLYTIPLQLLAYYVAKHKGHDIDQPRNLAKSVTVE